MKKYFKESTVAGILMLLLFVFAATAFMGKAGVLLKADADGAEALDPLNGLWQNNIVDKNRLQISYRGTDFNMNNFTATNETVTGGGWLETNKTENVRTTAASAIGASSTNYVFANAAVEGSIPSTITLSPDFYGTTEYSGTSQKILVNSYLVKHGTLAFDIRSGDKLIGSAKATDVKPAYQFQFYGDIIWHDAPALDKTTIHDITTFDWNKDGYGDYAVTLVTTTTSNTGTKMRLLIVDGKALYNACLEGHNLTSADYKYINGDGSSLITGSNVVGGDSDVKPVTSIRMTKGDFDGDGTPELACYFTKIHGAQAGEHRANKIEVYKINADFSGQLAYESDLGEALMPPDVVGIAAGDTDKDGSDELFALYGRTDLFYQKASLNISVLKWDTTSKTMTVLYTMKDVTSLYDDIGGCTSAAPINAAVADLDGDGNAELLWNCVRGTNSSKTLYCFICKWADASGSSSQNYSFYSYDMSHEAIAGHSWEINGDYMHSSLCIGSFNNPDSNNQLALPKLIGMAQEGGGDGTGNNLDYGVYSWNKDSGLVCLGHDVFQNVLYPGNLGPVVTAVDLNDESLVLGAPQTFTVTDNIETVLIAQAPPKHWDRILAEGSSLSADQDGTAVVDAFSLFPKDSNAATTDGYYLALAQDSTSKAASSTTKTSGGSWGAAVSYQLNSKEKLKDKIFANNSKETGQDPLLDAGIKYSGSYAKSKTTSYTSSMTTSFAFEANRDDQLYYKCNNYVLTRYPVLYPASKRNTVVSDDDTGENVSAQNYLQFIVPQTIDTSLSPTSGRSISWYEPMHDNYNLFTYPVSLNEISGYPQGAAEKEKANPYDPWLELNGALYGKSTLRTNNPDLYNFGISVTDTSSQKEMSSLKQTVGGNINIHPKFGLKDRMTLKLDFTGDGTWGTDSTTTTDASKMLSVKLFWPGTSSYSSYLKSGLTQDDMAFNADFGYYSQDDGTIAIGFAVPNLKSTGKLWGVDSPYMKHPDPGLNLPYRFSPQITKDNELTENTDKQQRYLLRGIKFEKTSTSEASGIGNLQNGLGVRLLEKGTSYDISLRVINYSFVTAPHVTVKYYYQPLSSTVTDAAENYPADDPASSSKCTFLASQEITPLAGRTSGVDNWAISRIRWDVPDKVGIGYLHVVTELPDGTELNAGNNHGYTLLGIYDPTAINYSQVPASASQVASLTAALRPDLEIVSVSAVVLNKDGTEGKEVPLNSAARRQRLKISARVRFTGGIMLINGKEKTVDYMPVVRVGLFAGKKYNNSLLAADEHPLMKSGEVRTLSFVYEPDKAGYDTNLGVSVKILSPFISVLEQKDSTNTEKVLWKSLYSDSSSSGGCNAGFPAALMLLASFVFYRKKK